MTNDQVFWLWMLGFPAAGLMLGVAGMRLAALRYLLTVAGPLYSGTLFVYGLFRGGPNECVDAPQPPGYICHPTSFLSDIGWLGIVVVAVATIVSFAPLVSAWWRSRIPSALGAGVLIVLIVLFIFGLLLWVPAAAALVGAAVAGPPRRRQPVPAHQRSA